MQMLHLIFQEGANVNHQHSQTDISPLMVAAAQGMDTHVQRLLRLGADPKLVCRRTK